MILSDEVRRPFTLLVTLNHADACVCVCVLHRRVAALYADDAYSSLCQVEPEESARPELHSARAKLHRETKGDTVHIVCLLDAVSPRSGALR